MSDHGGPNHPPQPRATQPLRPPELYAVALAPALLAAWRDAVAEFANDAYAQSIRESGIEPDGKQALIAWLRCDATRELLKRDLLPHRAERGRLLAQSLGFWDNKHVTAIDSALADRAALARLVDAMLRQMANRSA